MWIETQPVPGRGTLVRPEPFGGTIAFRRPEMLVLVNHAWLGKGQPAEAEYNRIEPAAPFEAHLTLGHSCSAGCRGCYIDARSDADGELDLDTWKEVLKKLASLGVYHLALGGGESLSWDVAIELARTARRLGMTPNFSTAGLNLTPGVARRLGVFERIHLSLDGTDPIFTRMRGQRGYESALMSLRILRAYHKRVGVNCVVGRLNADRLDPLFGLLGRSGIRNVELLRFKPVGRGRDIFEEMDLTPGQARRFLPGVLELTRRYRMRVRLDCSFTPLVCAAEYDPGLLTRMGLAGCVGGSWLCSVDARGGLAGCSFDTASGSLRWSDLGRPGCFDHFRCWSEQAPEPCASCSWLAVCRGGCHVVARHVSGSFQAPDPGCPCVRKYYLGL